MNVRTFKNAIKLFTCYRISNYGQYVQKLTVTDADTFTSNILLKNCMLCLL